MAVNIGDPYNWLGVSPTGDWDVGEPIYSKGNINKWSFVKPVIHSSSGELATSDLYSVNDGFTIKTYNHPVAAIQSMVNGATDNWLYKRPVNGVDWARLSDWEIDGVYYNHSIANWFNLTMSKTSGASGTSVTVNMSNRLFLSSASGGYAFKNFAAMNSYKSNYAWGLIFWKSGATDAYFMKMGDNVNVPTDSEHDFAFTIPSSLPTGNYYVMPTVTTYKQPANGSFTNINKDLTSYVWFAFPSDSNASRTFTVGSAALNVAISINPWSENYDSNYTYYMRGIDIYVDNNGSTATGNVNIRAEIVNYDGGSISPSNYSAEILFDTANIAAGGSYETSLDFDPKGEGQYLRFSYGNTSDIPQLMVSVGVEQRIFNLLTGEQL